MLSYIFSSFIFYVYLFCFFFFFFNDTATTEIYTLSLHDALPIFGTLRAAVEKINALPHPPAFLLHTGGWRSEEHTSELQSHLNLVCRLLLEKKNTTLTQLHSIASHNRSLVSLFLHVRDRRTNHSA